MKIKRSRYCGSRGIRYFIAIACFSALGGCQGIQRVQAPSAPRPVGTQSSTAWLLGKPVKHVREGGAVTNAAPIPDYVIPAGVMLSDGLGRYVQKYGWSLRWNARDDYRLDAPLPIHSGSVKDGVIYVVHTYQSQGGLLGDVPRFADINHIIVMEPATSAEGNQ